MRNLGAREAGRIRPGDTPIARDLISLVVVALLLVGCLASTTGAPVASTGQPIPAGQRVASPSGLYTITLPDDRWARVSPGTLREGADLEFYGPSTGTWAVSYVNHNESWSLDDIVAARRDIIGEDIGKFSFQEERRLMPGVGVPVSFARYSHEGTRLEIRQRLWVATVVSDGKSIEVIGSTLLGAEIEESVERLVKSLHSLAAGGSS